MTVTSSGNPFLDAAMLAMEAQEVIGLRLMKLAQGGAAAEAEMRQMIDEKMTATVTATTLMTAAAMQGRPDQGADDVVQMLRTEVLANKKRLSP